MGKDNTEGGKGKSGRHFPRDGRRYEASTDVSVSIIQKTKTTPFWERKKSKKGVRDGRREGIQSALGTVEQLALST